MSSGAIIPGNRRQKGSPSFFQERTASLATFAAVALLHVLLIALLTLPAIRAVVVPAVMPARLIVERRPPPPRPPAVPLPVLAAPPPMSVPVPEIAMAASAPISPARPRAVTRAGPAESHFGAATESGLGLDIAAAAGGGAGTRGTLASFEAAVRRRVLAGKRQPVLAWDRRNTCIVNYRVTVSRSGTVAGFSIEPCAIPEINQAARTAIAQAGPFPLPPDLGAATYDVHGALIFHP